MNQSTTCPYCGVGCGVRVKVEQQRIVTVSGDPGHPANHGRLCVKGSALHETAGADDRLLYPRVDGTETGWAQALDAVSGRLGEIIERHGPGAVAMYLSGQLLTEDYYVANKLMKGFIGSSHVDTNSRLCMSSTVAGYKRAFGGDLMPCSYEDIDEAELMLLVGSNAAWNHPVLLQRIVAAKAARPNLRVVLIDPRRTATAEMADLHLPLKPGADALIFNGLLTELVKRGRVDRAYIADHTEGFAEACEAARATAPDLVQVAQEADIPLADLQLLADWFCDTERTLTFFSQGINQSSTGTDKVNAIINCHLATGRIGRPGMGPFSLTGQPNAMGGREVGGLANQLAAHMDFSSPDNIGRVESFWKAPNMVRQEGLKAVDLFDAIEAGEIKAVWIMATNPVVSLPDADRVRRALQQCELVIVSECMAATDTLALADIALPATTWGEKNGTVTNSERRISRQRSLVPPPGQARHDWWALCEVARRLGHGQAFSYRSPAEIFREHARLSGFGNDGRRGFDISALAQLSDADYDALQPIQWPVNARAPRGTPRLFADGHFFTPSGKARLLPVEPQPPKQQPVPEYPLLVNSGRIRDQWHTMTRTGRAARLLQHHAEPFIEVHPADARHHGIEHLQLAELHNDLGSYLGRVHVSEHLRQGEVFIPMHWSGQFTLRGCSGSLFAPVVDPFSGQPESKQGRSALRALPMRWEARLLVRTPLDLQQLSDRGLWWTRVPLTQCVSYRLADSRRVEDWHSWCEDLVGPPSLWQDDPANGHYRAAGIRNGQLDWILLVEPDHQLPDLDWLDARFAGPVDPEIRRQLLAARAPGEQVTGTVICSCFQVREPDIIASIGAGARSAGELGDRLRCGTNCGSCLPELKALVTEHAASTQSA